MKAAGPEPTNWPANSPRPQTSGSLDLRTLVKACAQSPLVVDECNRTCGLALECPISALVEDRYPLEVSDEEALEIERFILFVLQNLWAPRAPSPPAKARRAPSRAKAKRGQSH